MASVHSTIRSGRSLEDEASAEDREHLSALSIGHFILAGVAILGGVPTLVYGVAASKLVDQLGSDVMMALGQVPSLPGGSPLDGSPDGMLQQFNSLLITAIVAGLVVAIVTFVHLVVVGVKIRQRRWWLFCYLTGWGECLMFPFGTILGIFTIIVLGRPSVKRLFSVH